MQPFLTHEASCCNCYILKILVVGLQGHLIKILSVHYCVTPPGRRLEGRPLDSGGYLRYKQSLCCRIGVVRSHCLASWCLRQSLGHPPKTRSPGFLCEIGVASGRASGIKFAHQLLVTSKKLMCELESHLI